jgi:O-acetyl-ADP-ribose deacetylase (regulator of RNase III)
MLHIGRVTSEHRPTPLLVLCAREDDLVRAWRSAAPAELAVHRGSVLDVAADAVVSPANSYGSMGGGIDAMYAAAFPGVAERVRSEILATHGGELPVGDAVLVPTGVAAPAWLISAPTMREPVELLPADTVAPYLAARAVFRLWSHAHGDDGTPVRELVRTIAMPGLGTGVGGVDVDNCARQVVAAWFEVFADAAV